MRYIGIIMFVWVLSCTTSSESSGESATTTDSVHFPAQIDTVLEANNPEDLDLSEAQLFQDTTRNSSFYRQVLSWSPRIYHQESIQLYVDELKKGYRPAIKSLKKFPQVFIRLRKFENEFFLYDQCDGIDTRFEIKDGLFLTYEFWEVKPKAIEEIVNESQKVLELIVWDNVWEKTSKSARVLIEKSHFPHIYSLSYRTASSQRTEWVTPLEEIASFDLIVNHCPKEKIAEYAGFESK
ncbi:MAG: hypothetical protein AAF694_22735 [Bacteroidota bacterium]